MSTVGVPGEGGRMLVVAMAFAAVWGVLQLSLIGGLALLLAGLIFFPPSIGFASVAFAGLGAPLLVPVSVAVSTELGILSVLGVSEILLSQANAGDSTGSGGGTPGGGSSVPDLPQKPPAPKPQVQNFKLRRIVDDLWKGTNNPRHIGDGTTMDAIRNENLTGRPTEGLFHTIKGRDSLNALNNWIRDYGPSASRADRLAAWRLKSALEQALGIVP